MPDRITPGPIHHLRMTVTDLDRSRRFYTEVLGFQVAVGEPPPPDHPQHAPIAEALRGGIVLVNGDLLFGLRPAAPAGDRFDEDRVGLDHLSFAVSGRDDLERAARALDEWGVPRGEIKDLGPGFGLYVLPFRDPNNIQLELTAPYGA
ncbi:MAG TPA: VOC family protein [Thermomicrobiales bacterium]|nr:VOC family protein [Thermomicrobiales bacterium]